LAIQRDLSALASGIPLALPPDNPPEITPLLIEHWNALDAQDRNREMAHPDARIRHSWAGACSRAMAYNIKGEEPSNPLTTVDYYRFALGKMVHEFWQPLALDALAAAGWTDIEAEMTMTTTDPAGNIISAGHGDLYAVSPEGIRTKFEVKSINGMGFKNILGIGYGVAGPRYKDLLQGCVNADASGCEHLRMVYLSLELVSPAIARKNNLSDLLRFCAEWTFTKEQWLPLAEAERGRWDSILSLIDADELPARVIPDPEIPADAVIVDPKSGRWDVLNPEGYVTNSGRTWHCDYCSFRHKCQTDS
jgi:hypothetical protein